MSRHTRNSKAISLTNANLSLTGQNWWSGNTSIASINSQSGGSSTWKGVFTGTTTSSFQATTPGVGSSGLTCQSSQPAAVVPTISLLVAVTSLTLGKQGQSTGFTAQAVAGGGFTNPIAGTITISEPSNPDDIALTSGTAPMSISFNLGPGGSTQNTCTSPTRNCDTVSTSNTNPNTGTLSYVVTLDPSTAYTVGAGTSPKTVTVTVH